MLVLAIAGLIFLMVFIGLPALQRSQRNTRRRQDMSRIKSAVTDYLAANNRLPFRRNSGTKVIDQDFVTKYIDEACTDIQSDSSGSDPDPWITYKTCSEKFSDPDGTPYILSYEWDTTTSAGSVGDPIHILLENDDKHKIVITTGTRCNDGSIPGYEEVERYIISTKNSNDFAMRYILEGGSIYCLDTQ